MMQDTFWQHAGENWDGMAFPLRPGSEEMDLYRSLLGRNFVAARRALILGVTPQLQDLGWHQDCVVEAADKSARMIETFWKGAARNAMHCDWRSLPSQSSTFDVVLTDGGSVMLDHPDGQTELARSVRRVLKPGGCFVARCYTTPDDHPSFAEVRERFLAGGIRNMSAYKLLAGMANALESSNGSRLSDVYNRTMQGIDEADLCQMSGCRPPEIASFGNYRDAIDTYYFVVRDDLLSAMKDGGLRIVAEAYSASEWGHLCPLLRFEPVT